MCRRHTSVYCLFAASACLMASSGVNALSQHALSTSQGRRAFLTKSIVASSAVMGASAGIEKHGSGCRCSICISFGSQPASAYDREVGGDNPSADTAAFNIQAKKTNARLEEQGFKLDTREEEEERLSNALSSYTYDSSSSQGKQNKGSQQKAPGKPLKK